MNSNIVSINIAKARKILNQITDIIDNEYEITTEEHAEYISIIGTILQDDTLGDDIRDNLLIAKQHLRRYSRFTGVIKE